MTFELFHYDRQGRKIPLLEWGLLHESEGYIRIGEDFVGGARVSTVWIGIDHGFEPNQSPLIFETMVFSDDENWDELTARYATEEEARQGHAAMVFLLTADADVEGRKHG